MNIFDNILNKAKSGLSSYNKTMEGVGSNVYDWANPNQDPIQRFLDDPKVEAPKKQAVFADLQVGKPKEAISSYIAQKYYPDTQAQFHSPIPTLERYNIDPNGNPAVNAGKQVLNVIPSLLNVAGSTVNLATTAYNEGIGNTASMLGKGIVRGAGEGGQNIQEQYQQGGGVQAATYALDKATKYIGENPGEFLAPSVGKYIGVKGGTALVRGAEVVAPKVVKGLKTGASATAEGVGKVTKSIVSQQSGLGTPAIESFLKTPELQGKIRSGELSVARTLEEARGGIDQVQSSFRETGKMYDTVRKSNAKVSTSEAKQVLVSQLESEGLASGGNLNLVDLPVKDRGAITQALKYIDEYKGEMNPQSALSIRQKLDDLINYKSEVGSNGQRIVQGLRAKYDEFLGQKLPGLKEIDAQYAPERQFWESIRKDIYKADGTLKDNALSVISNITNKGNEARLARMEQILPGIGEKVKALKAFDDIQAASGIKVGTYTRAATTGGLALVNPVLAIATWVATHPVVVARVLESIGLASQKIKAILAKGSKITPEEAKIVQKAITEVPKSKAEAIINNLSYDPKTSKLTSGTLGPKKLSTKGKLETAKVPKSIVAQENGTTPKPLSNESKVKKPKKLTK